ncbi:DNA (cytosine-5)-methyltransferase 1-like isoform X2 [Dermacentor albipictus]
MAVNRPSGAAMTSAPVNSMECPTEVCEAFESPHSACVVGTLTPPSSDMASTPDYKPTPSSSHFTVSDTGMPRDNAAQANLDWFVATIGQGEDLATSSLTGHLPIIVKTEEPQVKLNTSVVSDKTDSEGGLEDFDLLNNEARSLTEGNAEIFEEVTVHIEGASCSLMTSLQSPVKNIGTSFSSSLSQVDASTKANVHESSSALNDDNVLPSTSSSSSAKPSRIEKRTVPSDRETGSASPSPVRTSGRARARKKSALQSSDDASPSTSSGKTDDDEKCAGPSGHVKASSRVGHGTKSSAPKKQRMKKVSSDNEFSQASSPPSMTTSASHPDAATTPKGAGTSARKGACRESSGKRVVRKPLRYDDEGAPPAKKEKAKDAGRSPASLQGTLPVAADDIDRVTWCKDCRKRLNPSEVVFFKGDPEDAVEEFVAIIDPRLTSSLCNQDVLTEQPQFKITLFTLYDQHGHVCPFDGGLIEADVTLYLSGHVKSICAEDPGVQDSVVVARAGPIVSWWTTGYDGGANVVLGLTTEHAEYVLMTPSAQYEPYVKRMQEKTYLMRGILEKLIECGGDASFDDVMHHLESLVDLPSDVGPFSMETLHRHSQFVVDHVQAYDAAGDAAYKDTPLLDTAFIRELMRVTGAFIRDVPKGRTLPSVVRKEIKKLEPKVEFVMPAVYMTLGKLRKATDSSAKKSGLLRKYRCGLCEACLAPECKLCVFCRNMKKYGGPGTLKQCCIRRRCQQRHLPDSVDCAGTDSMDHEISRLPDEPFARREFFKRYRIDCAWTGDLLETTAGKIFYSSCRIGSDLSLSVGDDVIVLSSPYDTKRNIGRVTQLYADSEGKKFAHVIWFRRYQDTVLGSSFVDVSDELFSTTECDAVPLEAIGKVCCVVFRGTDVADDDVSELKEHKFFYRFLCHATTCTFTAADAEGPSCMCSQQRKCAKMFANVPNKEGGCFFVKPGAIRMPLNSKLRDATPEDASVQGLSGDEFTERYRKVLYPPEKEECSSPDPYRICFVLPVQSGGKKRRCMVDSPLIVQPFYRDYEVHKSSRDKLRLYLSPRSFPIAHTDVVAPCEVVYSVGGTVGSCFDTVRPPFYFSLSYDAEQDTYTEPDNEAKQIGLHLVSSPPTSGVLLKSVDVYCGCGGLSLGLALSGVVEAVLALSDNEHHLETFSLNFPLAATPLSPPSKVLQDLHAGKVTDCLESIKRGTIGLVCGSPSFESWKNSDGQGPTNSQLVTFLGFCEFFDPLYVVLVAERRAVKYHNGSGLALALKCLLDLGYQTSCSILQDGCYGMPQRHRRLVIFGAKRGLAKLPAFPAATHAFDVPERHLSFAVDGRAYASPLAATSAAPYPRTTLRDAIGDLSSRNRAGSVTDFCRFLKRSFEPSDTDLVKKMTPMTQARIALIPKAPGSDWRDLPNREVQLSDGTTAYRLIYTHKCWASPYGRLRGVCSCAEDDRAQCDPMYRQENTLIPWSLVHTGHRSGQWSGVYGRLQWDGYLHGVVANPEPLSKQGPVIHPEEDRVLSVRECARIQGYPDDFVFVGPTLEMYKMIARSVAPLLALALGTEIAKVLP